MSDEPKIVSPAMHLQALALFTMARKHYAEMRKYELALVDLLGCDDADNYMGHVSDAIYEDVPRTEFDEALKKQGITVAADGGKE